MHLRLALNFCIFSQILGALYALRPASNFYEILPWCAYILMKFCDDDKQEEGKMKSNSLKSNS
jgi:hypothetical protein